MNLGSSRQQAGNFSVTSITTSMWHRIGMGTCQSRRWNTIASSCRVTFGIGNDADCLLDRLDAGDAGRRSGQGRLSSGKGIDLLRSMIQAMYGDWERYCGEAHRAFAGTMFDVDLWLGPAS